MGQSKAICTHQLAGDAAVNPLLLTQHPSLLVRQRTKECFTSHPAGVATDMLWSSLVFDQALSKPGIPAFLSLSHNDASGAHCLASGGHLKITPAYEYD